MAHPIEMSTLEASIPLLLVVVATSTWLGPLGCGSGRTALRGVAAPTESPALSPAEIAALIPARVDDRPGWSEAISNAIFANHLKADRESVCAVIAVIGQESGFAEDPVVPGLAALAAARVERYRARLGPLGEPLFRALLEGHAPGDARSFRARLAIVRTEHDVDRLFRDLLGYYEANHPAIFATFDLVGKLLDLDSLAELNPITTSGSMQVSVRFAEDWAREHEDDDEDQAGKKTARAAPSSVTVRESLYTRRGGVYYGTARLLSYPVRYQQAIFRFADYNAGFYASRNAALQAQLSQLTGLPLARDGDLLSYRKNGTPREDETESMRAIETFARRFAPRLSADQIESDLRVEKTLGFEDTETYRAIRAAAGQRPYATLPQVALTSPKLSRTRSTAWFAQSVDRRYQICLGEADSRRRDPVAAPSIP